MSNITLQVAHPADFKLIYDLAKTIWNAHYVSIIGQEQVDYMLLKMYNYDSLYEQATIKKHHFYLIKHHDTAVGFVSVSSDNGSDYMIHKFYILSNESNSGLGTQVLKVLIDLLKPKSFKLTVNRQNYKSINFYFKNGFKITEVADFDIGNGFVMNDFVMKKTIA